MKSLKVLTVLVANSCLILTGCGKSEPPPASTPTPGKGTIQTAVEGFTGKTAVDYGLKAKEQIKAASEVQKRDRDEAMQ